MYTPGFLRLATTCCVLFAAPPVSAQLDTGLFARAFQPGHFEFAEPFPATDFITVFERQAWLAGWRTVSWTELMALGWGAYKIPALVFLTYGADLSVFIGALIVLVSLTLWAGLAGVMIAKMTKA